ncbi:MAG: tetratricopeptide repeat protein [Paludibacteraceae bacterium]|nr:tetratricopeptide repeat protein [Paludibacteraceae bacterium]
MKKYIVIILTILLVLPVSGKKRVSAPSLSVEQEQQFRYYWYAARQAIEQERYADAYALLQFCNAINPDDAQTLTFLGVLYQGIGQTERAKETFKRAYELAPNDCWQRHLEPLRIEYIEQKEWKKALKIQDEIDKRKGEYDAMSALTRYRIYAMSGQNKKAIKAIDKYLKTDPTNLQFLLFRLELMEYTGARTKDLFAMYERILELDPYNLMVLNNYAWFLAIHGKELKKAEQMSAKTIQEQPSNSTFLDTYGWILHLQGQEELARFYLQKALWNATDENRNIIQQHLKAIDN